MSTDVVTATSAEGNGRRARFRAPARALVVMTAAAIAAVVQSVPVAAAPSCDGRAATIVGTDKADKIQGTPRDDVIDARAGSDRVEGLDGDDRICGGPGKDRLDGNLGRDRLFLEKGRQGYRDYVAHGGAGADFIRGEGYGEDGNDLIVGTRESDYLSGGDGHDVLKMNDLLSHYTLVGDHGDDRLVGGSHQRGGPGDDTLVGDRVGTEVDDHGTSDNLQGGPGADQLDGGVGTDCVDYHRAESGMTVDLGAGRARGEGEDSLVNVQVVLGSRFNDQLVGGPNPDFFAPRGGDDSVDGQGADDSLWFGYPYYVPDASTDVCPVDPWAPEPIMRAVVVDLLAEAASGHGQDTIVDIEDVSGTGYADTIKGDDGDNFLFGVKGSSRLRDTVLGREGDDLLDAYGSVSGGEGDDRVVAYDPLNYEEDPLDFDGGIGSDWFIVRGRCSGWDENSTPDYRIDLDAGTFQQTSAPFGPIVPASLVSLENVLAGGCDEVIIGDDGPNILDGGAERSDHEEHVGELTPSNDMIRGNGGDDEIYGRNDDDVLYGGDGLDSVDGGPGSDECDAETELSCETDPPA